MTSLPTCRNCFRAMYIEWRISADGDKISRASCFDCGDVMIIPASATTKDARNGVSSLDSAGRSFGERPALSRRAVA